jgi:DNA repair exonuclease SbcCD ATPase subunit
MSEQQLVNAAVEGFAAEAGTVPVVNVQGVDAPAATQSAPSTPKFYTEEDLAKVRAQEKDKLYPAIDQLKGEVAALKKEKEEKAARKAEKEIAEAAEKEAKQKAKLENDLDAKQLLKLKEKEWQEQLDRERQERETAFALLERERDFNELNNYRQSRLEQEREGIIPELLDMVSGNTREELDASLASLRERSSRILESAQAAMQNTRKEMAGTRVTTPPAGPLENQMESRQFSAADIANMDMGEYAKYRNRLLSERAQGRTQGLFG